MSEIQIQIPKQQPELEAALCEFVTEEFKTQATFSAQESLNVTHKDASLLDAAWQVAIVIATFEGALQFADRVQRMERVKKLLAAIKKTGKSVYFKINHQDPVDLSKKSVDETMDFLAKKDKEDKM